VSPAADQPDDATPLTPDEKFGLIAKHVATRGELNALEQRNILKALRWASSRRRGAVQREPFLVRLHRRMFGDVWAWAGQFTREYNRRIGVDANLVAIELNKLVGDVDAQIAAAAMPADEIAARFHHRLTWIHPFPNGNGRHARLAADLLLEQLGSAPFTWGGRELRARGIDRETYIAALRAADRGDIGSLLDFVRR
jgi:Fic-DOC domain mobile mystery protein B